jgi:hypothetical protein
MRWASAPIRGPRPVGFLGLNQEFVGWGSARSVPNLEQAGWHLERHLERNLSVSFPEIAAIETHEARLGRTPRLVAADAAFYSARNEAAAKARGVKRVCIPNRRIISDHGGRRSCWPVGNGLRHRRPTSAPRWHGRFKTPSSPDDLYELLTESLREYERELHGEQNPVRGLWDRQGGKQTFRPVEEDSLSDDIRLYLRRRLVESGIVANREVEIARVPGAPIGTRTDIRIDALRRSADGAAYDTITAVIETKGCWNTALFTALKDQLYDDYMISLRSPVGIYLVGWFDKAKWDANDHRKRHAPDCTLQEAQDRLDSQAATIPVGFLIRPVVIDCHAP